MNSVTSTIDWCETNYQITDKIAEFENSISCLVFIILPFLAWNLHYKKNVFELIENRFHILNFLYICIGVGSILFHSQLSKLGQTLDEVAMMCTLFQILWILKNETQICYSETKY